MKACVLHAVGDFRYEDVPTPSPETDDVLIRVRACGVCGSDIPRVFIKGAHRFPLIPGHEFAGEVIRVGPNADPGLVNQGVAVFPLIPCQKCPSCDIGAHAQCENYSYLGSRCDGAFAEFVRAPDWNVVLIPSGVSFEEAALVEPAAVAAHALRKAGVDLGDTVLIFGAGPIGLLVAFWARAWGAGRVLLADIDDAKLEFAAKLGFTETFNPKNVRASAWVEERTSQGADLVVEASGSSAALDTGMICARPFGKVILMGNPAGEMKLSQDAYWAILRRELTLHGSWNSVYRVMPRDEWRLALNAMASGQLNVRPLITHRVALEQLPEALVMMRDRTEFFSKIMFVNT